MNLEIPDGWPTPDEVEQLLVKELGPGRQAEIYMGKTRKPFAIIVGLIWGDKGSQVADDGIFLRCGPATNWEIDVRVTGLPADPTETEKVVDAWARVYRIIHEERDLNAPPAG